VIPSVGATLSSRIFVGVVAVKGAMSEAPAGEDGREEADQRKEEVSGITTSAPGAGGKRDAVDTSASAEGSTQEQGGQEAQAPQAPQPPQPHPPQPQAVVAGDPIEKAEAERNQVKRHVEASPQGRYLRFEDKLGTGQYKVVYRSYDTSMGIEVAWNTVNIKNLPKDEKKRIMNEVRLLQNLTHKNLVQFHGSWVNREKEEVIFVTEIMQSGSLME